MSYNESLRANSNYPPMSQAEWDNAPWNEKPSPVTCTVSCSYSKSVPLMSDESFTDKWYTIPELLKELQSMCREKLQNLELNTPQSKHYQRVLNNCKDWIEDEFDENFEDYED